MRNSKGLGTVEVMIAAGIVALVAVAAASLSQVANNASSYADSKLEAQALGNLFIEHLKNSESCANAIGGDSNLNNKAVGGVGNITNPYATAAHVQIQIPRLQAGENMNSNVLNPDAPSEQRQILPRQIQVNGLRLADGILVESTATDRTYMANVFLDAQPLDGPALRPMNIGSINVITDTAGTIVSCQSQSPTVMAELCSKMGCTYDRTKTPPCQCTVSFQYCYPISRYPIRFKDGRPECTQLGSGVACPPNQFLTEVSLGHQVCAPAPSVCPSGTDTSGAGGSVPGLIRCKCPLAGQTYLASGVCDPQPGSPTPPPSPTATPTATPGCIADGSDRFIDAGGCMAGAVPRAVPASVPPCCNPGYTYCENNADIFHMCGPRPGAGTPTPTPPVGCTLGPLVVVAQFDGYSNLCAAPACNALNKVRTSEGGGGGQFGFSLCSGITPGEGVYSPTGKCIGNVEYQTGDCATSAQCEIYGWQCQ